MKTSTLLLLIIKKIYDPNITDELLAEIQNEIVIQSISNAKNLEDKYD